MRNGRSTPGGGGPVGAGTEETAGESPVTDPMRVAIDLNTADAPESGQQRYLWRLGGWLSAQGHDVHFLTVRRQRDGVVAPDGTRLHLLHGVGRSGLRRYVRALQLDAFLVNPERARRFRGVHANVLRPGYGTDHYSQNLRSFRTTLGRLTRRTLRVSPWVMADRRWERRYYEAPDPPPEVIAISHYMRKEILDSYSLPEDHVHVVHNGVDLAEFSPSRRAELRDEVRGRWGIPPHAVCLLFLGHNFRRKGLWPLLRALGSLRRGAPDADVHLLVAGRGTSDGQRRRARRLVRSNGLEGAVHIVGPVRPAIHAFAAADIFIHLSWHDAFGFVCLEAMASGLPVVTTPYSGASELIEEGVSGLLVDPGDDARITGSLRRLLVGEERRRFGEVAVTIASEHSEEKNFRQVLGVMQTARARARGPVS